MPIIRVRLSGPRAAEVAAELLEERAVAFIATSNHGIEAEVRIWVPPDYSDVERENAILPVRRSAFDNALKCEVL